MATSLLIDQTWVRGWDKVQLTDGTVRDNLQWFLGRSPEVQELILRFPPSCVVRGTDDLEVPFYGTCALVCGYVGGDRVQVRQDPKAADAVIVAASELTYVMPWGPFTPELFRAARALSEKHEDQKPQAVHTSRLRRWRDALR